MAGKGKWKDKGTLHKEAVLAWFWRLTAHLYLLLSWFGYSGGVSRRMDAKFYDLSVCVLTLWVGPKALELIPH